jgi:hypothetical protein
MGPSLNVTATPFFDHCSDFDQTVKHFDIQAFLCVYSAGVGWAADTSHSIAIGD